MTGSDESSEGFLQRWSRQKIDAQRAKPDKPKPDEPKPDETAALEPAEPAAASGATAPTSAATKPEIDLSMLPSLESITAGTDIRAFLAPGVPAELARAALRRAWTTDATIRDFVGLAENAWDFNDPAAMPGFGPLEPGYDIKRAVAQLFGEVEKVAGNAVSTEQPASPQPADLTEKDALPETSRPTQVADAAVESDPGEARHAEPKTSDADFVHCDNNTAPHNSDPNIAPDEYRPRRNHGGALPQ